VIANGLAQESTEGRTKDRSNVFVIATLYSEGGSVPVRIRNLSPSGALIEGIVLPLPGALVRLSRGSFHVSGEVVWSADGRSGVRFSGSISVPEWLPGASAASGQHYIDELVFKAKLGRPAPVEAPAPVGRSSSGDVALELARLASGLTRLCYELAADDLVAARFPENLQVIEAAAQRLDALAKAVLTQK
jgi:hypothetical protein